VAQTPQVFKYGALQTAYAAAVEVGFEGTDDSSLVERNGGVVMMLQGPRDNVKVTTPEDILFVESVLRLRTERGVS
jgi:2-C-methyl-D-erythritol 4-phosphate cytidylyltransferase